MDKLDMKSKNLVDENISKIAELFPNCITEGKDENGQVVKLVDFDLLKQELSSIVVEGNDERYTLNWPGKKQAILTANSPINATLRPCREESVDFDNTQNLYIEGDNLDVLKLLRETYLNKVKMIYIDPPYNTGHDFLYEDDFATSAEDYLQASKSYDEQGNRMFQNNDSNGRFHSDWLSMMYSRLKLAKDLLSEDGAMFISIDDNEVANLKKICDEIFGENNFVTTIVVESGGAYGAKTAHKDKTIFKVKDYVLVYLKNVNAESIRVPLYDKAVDLFDQRYGFYIDNNIKMPLIEFLRQNEEIKKIFSDYSLPIDKNNISKLMLVSKEFNNIINDKLADKIYKDSQFTLKLPQDIIIKCDNEDIVNWNGYLLTKTQNGKIRHLQSFASSLKFSDDCDPAFQRCLLRGDLWKNFAKDMGNVGKEGGGIDFKNGKKPVRLIKNLIKWTNLENDIVLDFFSGSGTTADAVMQLNAEDGGNRKFICVQLPELCDEKSEAFKSGYKNICEIGKERIRRAGKKIVEDMAIGTKVFGKEKEAFKSPTEENLKALRTVVNNLDDKTYENLADKKVSDIGFRVLKLDSSCMKDVYYSPAEMSQNLLAGLEDNIKEDRTAEDLLFQVMLDMGVILSSEIKTIDIKGKKVFKVNDGNLVCCFDKDLSEEVVTEIAKMQPLYAVFRDASMSTDTVAVNFDQIFETYSPTTIRKVI